MPNKRDPNQKLLGVWLDKELMHLLDTGRRRVGQQRSQFIREAIVEKLRELGYDVSIEMAMPPDRTKFSSVNKEDDDEESQDDLDPKVAETLVKSVAHFVAESNSKKARKKEAKKAQSQ